MRPSFIRFVAILPLFGLCGAWGGRVVAATIQVGPGDSFTKIEAAGAGDEVVIAPGTYKFRVHLTKAAPANQPLIIRAQDPANPPVWDLHGVNVENAPGSYTAGDRGRGCWQLSGATNVHISGLVITGCHNQTANSAGVRYYNGAAGIRLRDVVFRDNDNGLTGGSQGSEITVEFCEFDGNGSLLASTSAPTHNIYIYGGTFVLRHSYAHDPVQSQNFHVRAQNALLEYNWFARAKSYAGDLMTDDDYAGSGGHIQTMTLRGNVIVQGPTQSNMSQIIAVYNDADATGLTLNLNLSYNTFVGMAGGRAALVHLSNADKTTMNVALDNNVIYNARVPVLVDDPATGKVTGTHNWAATGADVAGLTATVFGTTPGFRDVAANDFTLAPGSAAIGAALPPAAAADAPMREYVGDERTPRMFRVRASAKDIGAFESTTVGPGIGPYGTVPGGGTGGAAGGAGTGGGGGGSGGGSGTGGGGGASDAGTDAATGAIATDAGGCGCRAAVGWRGRDLEWGLGLACWLLCRAAQRRRRH